jgi:4-amino-4-deoxy-L-arabinose transferase-like glycosyltransferase
MLSMGREKGQASTSNAGGVLAVLAIFFIIEPLGRMTLQGDLDAQMASTASGRLAIIALLIHFSTKMMIDSLLLEWVRTATMNMDIDLFPNQQVSELESHADEAPPLG